MKEKSLTANHPRVGEILIIGSALQAPDRFIHGLCAEVLINSSDLVAGKVEINPELWLYCYGVCSREGSGLQNWDLIARNMLGYILLVDWNSDASFQSVTRLLDEMSGRYPVPVILAAEVTAKALPYTVLLKHTTVKLTPDTRLVFYQSDHLEHVRKVVHALFDLLVEQSAD